MKSKATFTGLVDLLAGNFGGRALGANDDFFAECTALTKPEPAVFIPGKFTERGKWMDGWESRRKRGPGHDSCILELGTRGRVLGFDIDTSHFHGNQPAFASVDASVAPKGTAYAELLRAPWFPLLEPSRVRADSQNLFSAIHSDSVTHLRLNIFPDGGVARFRAFGTVDPNFDVRECDEEQQRHVADTWVDLAALKNGGLVLACSDAHFGSEQQLLLPGRSPNMGGGWETRRRRGEGFDWVIVRLARPGTVGSFEVDTQHFKGNYPDRCSIEGISAAGATLPELVAHQGWQRLIPQSPLSADARHFFAPQAHAPITHVRLNSYPDGGVSRLRVWGTT